MKPSLVVLALAQSAVLIVAAGCKKPGAPAASALAPAPAPVEASIVDDATRRLGWVTYSGLGAEARQVGQGPGECTVTCSPRAGTGWTRQGCFGTETDFRFVSDNCGQLVILYEYPENESANADIVVGMVVASEKDPVALRLSKFMQSSSQLRTNKRHVMWLAGVLGVPGTAPRVSADGSAVEFVTIDKVPHALTFAALGAWVDKGPKGPTEASAGAKAGGGGLYQWVDEDGSTQVGSLTQVPPRLRSKAVAIEAEVTVMVNDNREAEQRSAPSSDYPERGNLVRELQDEAELRMKARKEAAERAPQGTPSNRNSLGEDHFQYVNRLMQNRYGGGGGNISDRTTPTCRWGGAACSTNFDCCSGGCVKNVCN